MSQLRSYLSSYQPESRANADDLSRMSAEAWKKRGYVLVHVDEDGLDAWLRQALTNYANRRFGPRLSRHGE